MNYETIVADLFERFPKLQWDYDAKFAFMGTEEAGAYIIFGSVLIPALEQALVEGDLVSILSICAFLEEVAEAAQKDISLETLLKVEVGEWLGGAANEDSLAPWLGIETKRICRYVPGLATQRIAIWAEENKRTLRGRLGTLVTRLRNK
jgi:hypothetical protein